MTFGRSLGRYPGHFNPPITFTELATLAQDRAAWHKLVTQPPFAIGMPLVRRPRACQGATPGRHQRTIADTWLNAPPRSRSAKPPFTSAPISSTYKQSHLGRHKNAPRTACSTQDRRCRALHPRRGAPPKKEAEHPGPAVNGHRDLRQHLSALHLLRWPEPPTRDLALHAQRRMRLGFTPQNQLLCPLGLF